MFSSQEAWMMDEKFSLFVLINAGIL